LTQTDLYLLGTELTLHPILAGTEAKFHLVFNVQTGSFLFSSHSSAHQRLTIKTLGGGGDHLGQTGGYNADNRDRDLPFSQKDEPATLPRVQQMYIISDLSPWCTTVKNDKGVTLGDICQQIWKE
jgi:hypothetical protein